MPRRLVNNQKRLFMRGIFVEGAITFHKTILTLSCLLFQLSKCHKLHICTSAGLDNVKIHSYTTFEPNNQSGVRVMKIFTN